MSATVQLKAGREKSLLRRHPWIFAGAIEKTLGAPSPGETVEILSAAGEFLAWGSFSPSSQIRARVWSWDSAEKIGADFFQRRLQQAIGLRQTVMASRLTDAVRLVHGESDGLPGLVVDRYADYLVVQFLTCGSEYWRDILVDMLTQTSGVSQIFERSDADVRQLEDLPTRTGRLLGPEPPELIRIHEQDLNYWVDIRTGHKTGFYLDQRVNRARAREYALGKDVLDCFSYTGGFMLNCLAGGAQSVTVVDASSEILSLGQKNQALNALPEKKLEWINADVFQVLRSFRDQRRSFDMIILDPPKFAPTVAHIERAARGYKDINLLSFKLLRPGGLLFTFSCSGGVSPELFQKIIADAALDAGVEAQILEHLHQDLDHPISLSFPEGQYLKGLIVRKLL